MAKRRPISRPKKQDPRIKCEDCRHCEPITAPHKLGYGGVPILCTCKFLPDGWTQQLMTHFWLCKHFEAK